MNNIHNIRYKKSSVWIKKMINNTEPNLKKIVYKYTLIFFSVIVVLNTLNYTFQDLSNGYKVFVLPVFVGEVVAFSLFYVCVPFMYLAVIKYPISRPYLLRNLIIQFVFTIVLATTMTFLMYLVRSLLWPVFGFGQFEYGLIKYRIVMEYSRMVLLYGVLYIGIYAIKNLFDSEQAKLKSARLEEQLAKSKIEALQMQLNPHFLFNTLNVISSTMYEDVNAADKMIADLSDLLRVTLNKSGNNEHPLKKEIEMLNLYADIMKMRFKDKLNFEIDADQKHLNCLVPVFILQPLVENSIRHSTESVDNVSIKVNVRKREENLVLTVQDSGPGISDEVNFGNGNGIGLSNTASRLENLYGKEHQLTMGNIEGGGFEVKISIPFRTE